MNATIRHNRKTRSTPKQWAVIIATVVFLHVVFLLFFKAQYLNVFKTEIPAGEEGDSHFPYLDNPFYVIPLAPESHSSAAIFEEATKDKESSSETSNRTAVGEPQLDLQPLQGGGAGGHGTARPRHATVEPKPLYIPWPKYPQGIGEIPKGSVELMLLINEKGEVEDIAITRKLPLPELNQIAVEAARKIRFTPGMIKGVRSAMWVRLAIGFQPR
jgi:TonB family protein